MTPLIEELILAFQCLPGVGPKSAQRMVFHLLEKNRKGALTLAETLTKGVATISNCKRCRTLSETELCKICTHPKRNDSLICVVESPMDILAIEQTSSYRGLYFVLMGHLSPLDGIGPNDIGLDVLTERLKEGVVHELIVATGTTVEGETTAHYIADIAKAHAIKATRIAYGIPAGGNLEYVDGITLAHALTARTELS